MQSMDDMAATTENTSTLADIIAEVGGVDALLETCQCTVCGEQTLQLNAKPLMAYKREYILVAPERRAKTRDLELVQACERCYYISLGLFRERQLVGFGLVQRIARGEL